mgnify:CR=1 FL=1
MNTKLTLSLDKDVITRAKIYAKFSVKIYIASDVILDYLYGREPFNHNAQKIIALIEKKIING